MPIMSGLEAGFCRSAPWQLFARRVVVPWAVGSLAGDVLEIGGGAGAMAEVVASSQPDVRLTVTDIDPEMVAAARRRLGSRARVEVADVTALPFADASYDVVCSWLMLHHVVVWPQALPEVLRVLRPGGRFVGYDLTDTALARLVHRVDGSQVRMVGAAELRERMVEAGFADVHVERSFAGHVMRFSALRPDV